MQCILTMSSPELKGILDDFPLDLLGQQERINRIYTQIIFGFPVPDDSEKTHSEIIETVAQSLYRLGAAFPWTAGQVVRGEDDVFRIKSSSPDPSNRRPHPHFEVKDLRDYPAGQRWDELLEKEFPFSMLDENVIAPCKTFVEPGAELPVLLVQANFVQGGLLLTINAQHGSMDMGGQAQVIALLAKALRGEVFSRDEVEGGNVRRTGWIPPLEDKRRSLLGAQEKESSPKCDQSHQEPVPAGLEWLQWAYLAFPWDSLTQIKTLALEHTPKSLYVSQDDALTAFLWQAIIRAHESRRPQEPGAPPPTTTTLTRNVNARTHFGLPSTYPGLLTTATSHTSPAGALLVPTPLNQRPLGAVATELRAALQDAEALRRRLRAQATAVPRGGCGGRGTARAGPGGPALDVKVSSWAREGLCGLDFGRLLGRPEAVRRPRFQEGAREGLVYFLPRTRAGEIVVGVCLVREDMQCLEADREVKRWARWIG